MSEAQVENQESNAAVQNDVVVVDHTPETHAPAADAAKTEEPAATGAKKEGFLARLKAKWAKLKERLFPKKKQPITSPSDPTTNPSSTTTPEENATNRPPSVTTDGDKMVQDAASPAVPESSPYQVVELNSEERPTSMYIQNGIEKAAEVEEKGGD